MRSLSGYQRAQRFTCAGVIWLNLALASAVSAAPLSAPVAPRQHSAALKPRLSALSAQALQVRAWVIGSGDHDGMAFALIDKTAARLHLFNPQGVLLASSPVLLGLAQGDHSVPGIGERKMSDILAEERTTPAGRFVSEPGLNLQGHDIVWIDYDAAVSLHRVRSTNRAERRLQRLASPTVADNRISYGCVNVPTAFYNRHIAPSWGQEAGVIYVLPETEEAAAFFGFDPAIYP